MLRRSSAAVATSPEGRRPRREPGQLASGGKGLLRKKLKPRPVHLGPQSKLVVLVISSSVPFGRSVINLRLHRNWSALRPVTGVRGTCSELASLGPDNSLSTGLIPSR